MKLYRMFVWLLGFGLSLVPVVASAQEACPAIPADGSGVQRIAGQGSYSFYGIPTIIVDQPVIALVDNSLAMQGDRDTFPSSAGQVIGVISSDFFSSPFSYTINLPAQGIGAQVDLDQDGGEDVGVQVYQVVLAQNVLNTVPLSGLAQGGVLSSYYRDNETEEIVQGAVVVYAPDDQQGFPCAYGADGKLFTADDPIATLPQGFTVANIADGAVTFDRSAVARVDVRESPSSASPDFSDQGILESFNTLIDFLRERYVFTEFYDIDWDALYATYLPSVEAAEAAGNLGDYFVTLVDLAHDLKDSHVYVQPGNIVADPTAFATMKAAFARSFGSVGAGLVELNDGRVIVTDVKPGGSAAAAGFAFGTEIVAVDGVPVAEALDQPVRLLEFPGTPEALRIAKVDLLLRQTAGTELVVSYRISATTDVLTTTLTTAPDVPAQVEASVMPMDYSIKEGVGYVTWPGFARTGIATHIFADFIKVMNQRKIPGIIIDLRSNGGGSALMEYAVMSYLFSAEQPLNFGIADNYTYNTLTGEFLREPQTLQLSSPPNTQPYLGDVVMLVNQKCASACEFMSYWLQASGRATIVGQYATEGAGGNTNGIFLPGGIQFNFTAGTNLDNETNRPTFQAVGVQPDVRVPVTEETEQRKQAGGDPVLDAGIAHLRRLAFARLGHESTTFISGTVTSDVPTGWTLNAAGDGYSSPKLPIQLSITAWTASDETNPDLIMLNVSPEVRKVADLPTDAGTWSIYGAQIGDTYNIYGVIVLDDQAYLVTTTTTDEQLVALMTEFNFVPALRSFTVVQ